MFRENNSNMCVETLKIKFCLLKYLFNYQKKKPVILYHNDINHLNN